jgi:hypothetical protein
MGLGTPSLSARMRVSGAIKTRFSRETAPKVMGVSKFISSLYKDQCKVEIL